MTTTRRGCPCCRFHRHKRRLRRIEAFTCLGGCMEFDIDKAHRIARRAMERGRKPQLVDNAKLKATLRDRKYNRQHSGHADVRRPGLGGVILDGRRRVRLLLDGAHRAARAVRERRKFYVVFLTPAETRRCILRDYSED